MPLRVYALHGVTCVKFLRMVEIEVRLVRRLMPIIFTSPDV